MSLRDHLALPPPRTGCLVGDAYAVLDPEDRDWLTDVLESSATATAVAAGMTSAGYPMSATTVKNHRRKECSCESR